MLTGSVDQTAAAEPTTLGLPPELSAVAPVTEPSAGGPSERPAEDLVASLEAPTNSATLLTQDDLNAMGSALTFVLSSDNDPGTFSFSNEATGRSGLMTPFRQISRTDDESCRVVSIEFTDDGTDAILLGDACLREGAWAFTNPRPGEVL